MLGKRVCDDPPRPSKTRPSEPPIPNKTKETDKRPTTYKDRAKSERVASERVNTELVVITSLCEPKPTDQERASETERESECARELNRASLTLCELEPPRESEPRLIAKTEQQKTLKKG